MKFESIPGLEGEKKMLREAVRGNHIPHAQLFAGAPGALGLNLALAFATYLHCQNRQEDSCGTCPACTKSAKYIHPDTHFVFPVGNLGGDKDEERVRADKMKSWRSFLLEQPFGLASDWAAFYGGEDKAALISREESREIIKALSLKSFESEFKVMVIWMPENMHPSAANGILKILEEPPPKTYFLLVTYAADRLLPTILSRTQRVNVPLLTDEELSPYLEKVFGLSTERSLKLSRQSEGNLNLAMKMVNQGEDDHFKVFAEWMRNCFKRNYIALVTMAEEFHAKDMLSQQNLLAFALTMMRETVQDLAGSGLNRTMGEENKFVKDFARVMNIEKVDRAVHWINESSYHIERNGSAKMIFLDMSLKLAQLFAVK